MEVMNGILFILSKYSSPVSSQHDWAVNARNLMQGGFAFAQKFNDFRLFRKCTIGQMLTAIPGLDNAVCTLLSTGSTDTSAGQKSDLRPMIICRHPADFRFQPGTRIEEGGEYLLLQWGLFFFHFLTFYIQCVIAVDIC